jgi:hypothetical protein
MIDVLLVLLFHSFYVFDHVVSKTRGEGIQKGIGDPRPLKIPHVKDPRKFCFRQRRFLLAHHVSKLVQQVIPGVTIERLHIQCLIQRSEEQHTLRVRVAS